MRYDPSVNTHWRRWSRAALLSLSLLSACAQILEAQTAEQIAGPSEQAQEQLVQNVPVGDGGVELGPGDTIALRMFGEEEVSKDWRISESGHLLLPLVGSVSVSGMTVLELERDLTERYRRFVRNPQLSISVVELRSRPATVTGAVKNPGLYQLKGGATLHEVLALAGGAMGAGTKVSVTRKKAAGAIDFPGAKWISRGEEMTVDLDLQAVVSGRGPEAGLRLRPFDMINVGESTSHRVYVSGEVNLPGAIQLVQSDSIRMTQAIAMAGGYKSSGQINKTVLWISQGSNGRAEMTIVDLKRILQGKQEDRLLRAGDYLIVPPRGARFVTTVAVISAMLSPIASLSMVIGRY